MDGKNPARGIGREVTLGSFSFGPNGTSNPVISGASSTLAGHLGAFVDSITYSATGIQTIVFKEGFRFPTTARFIVSEQYESLTEYFHANQVGSYNTTTRTLVVTAHRAGTGRAVPAHADARIHVSVVAEDTSS